MTFGLGILQLVVSPVFLHWCGERIKEAAFVYLIHVFELIRFYDMPVSGIYCTFDHMIEVMYIHFLTEKYIGFEPTLAPKGGVTTTRPPLPPVLK